MRFSALDGLRVGVWGAGLETRSFARHLADKLPRARIAVVVLEAPADAPELTDGARVVGAPDAVEALRGCDVLVRSPGVSIHRPELRALIAGGLPTTTPTGLWLGEREGRDIIGITATKGKSTIATLTAHLIRAAGVPVQLAGNIGRAALDLLDGDPAELAVIELSSYQIADLATGPQVAVASNLYREHLNWHLSEAAYRHDKLRLLALAGVRRCVLNATSPEVMAAPRSCATARTFGEAPGWAVTPEGVTRDGRLAVATADLPLRGAHNALNLCAALTALEAMELALPSLPGAFAGFEAPAHRLQLVHAADGVLWVDDSISTIPEAAARAVESFPEHRIVLIGGGEDRGQDHDALGVLLAARDAVVIGLPDTGQRLVAAARAAGVPAGRAVLAGDLAAAVALARAAAVPGTAVLLSPAAPSYNTHVNFAARGDAFRDLVRSDGSGG